MRCLARGALVRLAASGRTEDSRSAAALWDLAYATTASLFLGALIALGIATANRNEHHRTRLRLWIATVEKVPDSTRARYNLGVSYMARGEWGSARHEIDVAIRQGHDNPETYYTRAVCSRRLGYFQDAIYDFTLAIQRDNQHAEAYYQRGLAYTDLRRLPEARDDLSQAIRCRKDYAAAYAYRAACNLALRDYDAAWADVAECRRLRFALSPELIRQLTESSGRSEQSSGPRGR